MKYRGGHKHNTNQINLIINLTNLGEYRGNHYVPEWYQKRFLTPGQHRFHYLDLKPDIVTTGSHSWARNSLLRWGPTKCFKMKDLYTTFFGASINTDIEKFFFGPADREGTFALDHFETFELNSSSDAAFNALVPYMSLQKLRTPKGLAFLRAHIGAHNNNDLLLLLQKIRNIYCTIWSEAVWQIADAKLSPTKFIVSDHPVTVYNRECFPDSHHCGAESDPDITSVGTHTLFPLSMNKVLIITNLSWVRDPYQNPLAVRPNPELFRRPGLFSFLDIQFDRFLSEEEVIEINHVIKRRAYRYIAASEEDWLYPERQLKSDHWRKLGNGYLFMPDPRHVVNGGEVLVSYKSGHVESFSEYGHRPWQTDFKDKQRDDREWQSLHRFQAEWAAMIGPKYRGLSRSFGQWDSPRLEESAEHHQHLVNSDLEFRKRAGERARRRHLRR